jgi:hypothetical protein
MKKKEKIEDKINIHMKAIQDDCYSTIKMLFDEDKKRKLKPDYDTALETWIFKKFAEINMNLENIYNSLNK